MPGAAPFFFHQTGGLQHLQVLRYSRAAYGKLLGELAHCRGPLPQQVDNTLPGRVGERAQHLPTVSHTLP